jgi:peroxiredoxin
VLADYIYKEPMKAYAYFALFQGIAVGNTYLMVFNPRTNVDDVKPFSAVATSWDQLYPNSLRGENLHNITIEGMKTQRIVRANEEGLVVDADKVTEASLIDIVLPDNKGVTRRLTELKGKVVLLDFHIFASDGSSERILAMRELYNKYHDRGLEIYQVSLDEDAHFWKTQTAALPWVSVLDDRGAARPYLYQVQALPVSYIINRDNQVVMGPREITNLDTDIAKYL